MKFKHPLWLVGFRPFFALTCLAGAVLPMLWIGLRDGVLGAPASLARAPLVWHAHEMFFGFGGALLGGFLLTASKNWTAIRGWHGAPLALLVAAWLLDRLALAGGGGWPAALFWLATSLYPALLIGLLLHTLIAYRTQDSYRDNWYFIVALPLLLPAKWLLLSADGFGAGIALIAGVFRLAFLIMLERTLSQFMNAAFKLKLPRRKWLDHAIKGGALLLLATPWLPAALTQGIAALVAALACARWLSWHPRVACSRIDIGIMYSGYLAIVGQLAWFALGPGDSQSGGLHLLTLGALGGIGPAMIVRISKGHTGRKVAFDVLDRAVLWLMLAGLALRVVVPPLWPAATGVALWSAAAAWLLGWGTLGWRTIPFLVAPRADGREH